MKTKILILFAMLLIATNSIYAQANTPQADVSKIKELIKDYMFNNLGDYDSYTPISYGEVYNMIAPIEQDSTYKAMSKELNTGEIVQKANGVFSKYNWGQIVVDDYKMLIALAVEFNNKRGEPFINNDMVNQIGVLATEMLPLVEELLKYKSEYENTSPAIGIAVNHKYRAKNKFGGVELYEYTFGVNLDQTKIIKVEKIE